MSTSSTPATTTGPFDDVHIMIKNQPTVPNNLNALVTWLINIITAIMNMIEQIGHANNERITEVEEVTNSHATVIKAHSARLTAAAAFQAAATAPTVSQCDTSAPQ